MSNKLFLVGDFKSNTGPAIANKALKKALGKRANYSQAKTKIGRMAELVRGTMCSQVICFCGFSELNAYGIKLAKLFRKKTAYLMHGYIEFEAKTNHTNTSKKRIEAERYLLDHVGKIICVSNLLAEKVKVTYPTRKNSIYVVYNIVEPIKSSKEPIIRNKQQIMSTGGGMPQKNNLVVCEAIKKVNAELLEDKKLSYVITGKSYGMEKKFAEYDFVKFLGEVSHKECLRLMQESGFYIQDSSFETFGMAVIEAIGCGCDLVLSKNIGAREVITNMSDEETIKEVNDADEISNVINSAVSRNDKSHVSVNWDDVSKERVAECFLNVVEGA